jgi:hypothetical protein
VGFNSKEWIRVQVRWVCEDEVECGFGVLLLHYAVPVTIGLMTMKMRGVK